MRLIDADALEKFFKETHCTGCDNRNGVWCRACWVNVALAAIDSAPTIEAEPVRHGEWVGTEFDGYADGNPVYYLWQCSCCHEEYERDGMPPWYDYCPHCGAKMDGGTEK